jgi:hypothetical protein
VRIVLAILANAPKKNHAGVNNGKAKKDSISFKEETIT